MKLERFTVQACCGGKAVIFKTDQPLTATFLQFLVPHGYREAPNFTKAGILYVDNQYLTITGTLGQNRLQIKCKNSKLPADCDEKINDFEELVATQSF